MDAPLGVDGHRLCLAGGGVDQLIRDGGRRPGDELQTALTTPVLGHVGAPRLADDDAVQPAVVAGQRRPPPARPLAHGVVEADQRVVELIDDVGRAVGGQRQVVVDIVLAGVVQSLIDGRDPPVARPAAGVEVGRVLHVVVGGMQRPAAADEGDVVPHVAAAHQPQRRPDTVAPLGQG